MSLAAIEQLLSRSVGLDSASVGVSTIERAVSDRIKTSGFPSIEAYWEHLRDSASELQELIEAVVVPETWFFRDEEVFASLVRLAGGMGNRPESLRILSVPCSTGEEPYTVVMALQEGGVRPVNLKVDAVDVSTRVLEHAKRGVYGRNSFRSQNLAFRDRHFRAVKEGYQIEDSIAQAVAFHQGNLVTGQLPPVPSLYNVIFCRNVLIYFDRPTQERVLQTLRALLASDGFLFVGPAETFLTASSGFTSVDGAASFAFKKSSAKPRQPVARNLPKSRPPIPKEATPAMPPPPRQRAAGPPADLSIAQRLAGQGQLREAADACQRYLSERGPSAAAYYLLGVICDAAGDRDRAADCYRRVVYLEPNHAEALAHLALLSETQGNSADAHRFRKRARRAGNLEHGRVGSA